MGPIGCFDEPREVPRSPGGLGDGTRTGTSQFPVLVSNDDLADDFEAGFALGGVRNGGFDAFIAVATEVGKAQSTAFSGPDMDLQDSGRFCLKVSLGFGC